MTVFSVFHNKVHYGTSEIDIRTDNGSDRTMPVLYIRYDKPNTIITFTFGDGVSCGVKDGTPGLSLSGSSLESMIREIAPYGVRNDLSTEETKKVENILKEMQVFAEDFKKQVAAEKINPEDLELFSIKDPDSRLETTIFYNRAFSHDHKVRAIQYGEGYKMVVLPHTLKEVISDAFGSEGSRERLFATANVNLKGKETEKKKVHSRGGRYD